MSQEGYLARLGIDTSDIDSAVNKTITFLAELGDSFDTLGKWSDRATSSLIKNAQAAKASASATQAGAKAAADGTGEWAKYAKALDDANKAYRDFRKGQVTGEGGGTSLASLSEGKKDELLDTAAAQQANLIQEITKERRLAVEAARDEAAAYAMVDNQMRQSAAGMASLLGVQRQRAQADAAEANRQMEIRAALTMRRQEEEALARAVAATAAAERNRQRASAFFTGGVDTRLGQEPTGQRAADTGYAQLMQAQERQAVAAAEAATESYRSEIGKLAAAKENLAHATIEVQAAQKRVNDAMQGADLSEQIRETNALANAQEAHTRANRERIQAEEAANAALSRTRYALYDVSQAMQAVGVAGIAVTAAIAGSAVAYEAEFANVRRTVGVTGEAADDLYDSMIRMSTTIPTSFADLGQIGTLAGQLGVAEGRVASFTRTTAQFSATTDVTVDAAATAFGRLDTLLADVQGQYDRLGSSILNVGVNSVATESEIVAISNQIAAAAQQSNLAASEVVGLSAALASLGVKPEAARGSILRIFSQINTAIAEGGDALEQYADLAGMSAQQFREGWSSDFTGTFTAWLEGVQSSGKGAEQTLRDLGITAVRDLNALLRLAQNGDVLRESLDLAAEGFDNTSILAENFGIIATTNAAKIQILGNGLLGFFATLGQGTSGPLSDFLDKLIDVTQTLIRFADNPYVQTAGLIVTATAAIVGILGIVGGLVLRGVGSWIALRQAIGSTTAQTWLAAGGFRAMAAQMIGAEGAARGFGAALKATGIGLLITGGLWLLGEAVGAIASEMRTAQQVAEDYFGTIDGLTAAMVADDPTIVARAVREQGGAAREAAEGFDELVLSIAAQRVETERMQAAIAAGNEALAGQTFNIGENTRAWIQNALMQSEAFTQMFENASQLQSLMGTTFTGGGVTVSYEAFSMEAMIEAAAAGGSEAATAYVDEWYAGLARAFEQGGAGSADLAIFEALGGNEALTQVREMAEATGAAVEEGLAMGAAGDAAAYLTDQLLGTADAGYEMGDGMDYAAASAWNSSDAINQIISDAYGADNAARALSDSVYALGVEFANNGARAAVSSDAMQQVIQNILTSSGSAGQAAANLQGFFNLLVEGGYASASQLAALQSVIAGLTGGQPISFQIPKFNPANFIAGMRSVETAAAGRGGGSSKRPKGGAAAAVRTLVDYAGDLQKVFSRSFQIRFGGQQALDEVTTAWREMREEADDARATIRDATQEMNAALREHQATARGLLAEKAIVQYWLSVADAYDDALRAGELRARLAEIDDELASSSEDAAKAQQDGAETIADAQRELDRGLTGSGQAAIENRAKLLDLVEGYQDYIQELAASGMGQDELKARTAQLKEEFIRQATQLGYSREELGRYTAGFDDVRVAIERVPRNITVKANMNPALQALNEYLATVRNSRAQVGVSTPSGAAYRNLGARHGADYANGWILATSNTRRIIKRQANVPGGYAYHHAGNTVEFFKKGGWTGNGDPNEIAGLTHHREFVLNEQGAQMFPREMLEAANQGRAPQMATVAVPSGGGSAFGSDRALAAQLDLLAQIRDAVGVSISGDALQQSVNLGNYTDSRRGR